MARHFRGTGVTLRFIEYMDVGMSNGWRMDEVLPSSDVLARLREDAELVPLAPTVEGETATRWGYADGSGEIGLISSVTQAFCGDCNRARLSTEGQLYTCLFAGRAPDRRRDRRRAGRAVDAARRPLFGAARDIAGRRGRIGAARRDALHRRLMRDPRDATTALILCGGRATRMGGVDKPLQAFWGGRW
ncbi:molybdenum cofactor synthesis C domain-containing protein [Ditylenchus destructor]|nr:molybdenum cofactor synthesis C domain-containing protein [Ditylenchus destructor]